MDQVENKIESRIENKEDNKGNRSTKNSKVNGKRPVKKNGKGQVKQSSAGCKSSMNDPSWYAPNAQILKDAASIPFNTAVGNALTMSSHYDDYTTGMFDGKTQNERIQVATNNHVPGVWSINIVMGPGHSSDNNSAINVAARNIYSYVRYANSGHANYDSPDLMQYLLAMDSIYSYYAFLQRLYGVMNVYSTMNRYLPEALVRSMGVDFDDIQLNLANLRFYINQLAVKINSLYAPATMPIMVRHSWLFSNVFMDAPNSRAQLYIFNPEGFYVYDETLAKGQLQFKYFRGSEGKTFAQLVEYGNAMVNSVALSESFGIMGGDIKKAYTKLMTVSLVPETYSVVPVYNHEVLTQIEHAYALFTSNVAPLALKSADITSDPDTNALLYDPYITTPNIRYGHLDDKIINFDVDEVTPADVMVATRLLPTFKSEAYDDTAVGNKVMFDEFGTELCTTFQIYTFADKDGAKVLTFARFASNIYLGNNTDASSMALGEANILRLVTQFSHHPILYLRSNSAQIKDPVKNMGPFAQLGNVTTIDNTTLSKMHITAVLGEFGVPVETKFI